MPANVSMSYRRKQRAYLVAREDQGIGNNNVFPPTSGKDDDFSNVLGCKRLAVTTTISLCSCCGLINLRIDRIGLALISVEANKGEFLALSALLSSAMHNLQSRPDQGQSQ